MTHHRLSIGRVRIYGKLTLALKDAGARTVVPTCFEVSPKRIPQARRFEGLSFATRADVAQRHLMAIPGQSRRWIGGKGGGTMSCGRGPLRIRQRLSFGQRPARSGDGVLPFGMAFKADNCVS